MRGYEDLGTGPLGTIGNLIWLLLAGWWLALGHIITAVGLRYHRHMASRIRSGPTSSSFQSRFGPIGKMIVSTEEAEKLRAVAAFSTNDIWPVSGAI
jgi:uncharacterized membrane protein YccF (DUF307 family)